MNIQKSINKIVRERERRKNKFTRLRNVLVLITTLLLGIFIGVFFMQSDFSITGFASGVLPTVGGNSGSWGTILNNYLSQEHTSTGGHKNVTVEGDLNVSGLIRGNNWTNVSITESQISDLHTWNSTNSSYRTLDNLTFEGDVNVTGNLSVTNNLSVGGNLNVTGEINSTGLSVDGNGNFTGNVTISGNIKSPNWKVTQVFNIKLGVYQLQVLHLQLMGEHY